MKPSNKGQSEKEKERIINEMMPFIKYTAYRYLWRVPPQLTVDDLISVGVIGLLDAIEKYDPSKKTKLRTYAEFRIRGAMLDEIRANEWTPKTLKKKFIDIKSVYAEIEREKGRPATEEDVAQRMDISLDELYETLHKANNSVMVSIDELEDMKTTSNGSDCDIYEYLSNPDDVSPLEEAEKNDMRWYLASLIDALADKEKLVLSLYYYEELTFKEIGQVLDLTESRICQLHSQALLKLKGKINYECLGMARKG